MNHSSIRLFFLFLSVFLIEASEYCLDGFYYCQDYCCGFRTCCNSCANSVRIHRSCRFEFPIAAIIGIVIFGIAFLIFVVVFCAIFCGLIRVPRILYRRRDRMFNPSGGCHPQEQIFYPQSQNVYPGQYVPQTQLSAGLPPPYPVALQGYPPGYNQGLIPGYPLECNQSLDKGNSPNYNQGLVQGNSPNYNQGLDKANSPECDQLLVQDNPPDYNQILAQRYK